MNKINIHPQNTASLDVHTQYTFTPECPEELPVPEGTEIVDELNKQAQFAHYRIGSKEAHNRNAIWVTDDREQQLTAIEGSNVDVRWVPHSIVGTKGFELIEGLPAVTEYDYFIWEGIELDMHPYGVCYHDQQETMSTGLIEYLQVHHIDTVIVGGLATDFCVKTSVLQLLKNQLNVIVNLAGCRGLTPESVKQSIETMKAQGAQFIGSSAELQLFNEST